ncbi:hypothetical protein NIES37_38720 [Tolypothrix tenuis PCC 7101]|uniref:Chromosome partition protein Smc n=1 Tax=Tolypothrix tenuis PCC 7101 TaxID=231146 RepID=A0A1Z4N2E5_9CYAN|nr:hypothetical protein [Aulosira sp. FACHB-113]BAY99889.1 hypothetical protein NIES37_38720 [Tolypothrix tenuis PCC 7101]BAZ76189.1 hypothetical protein NIES50_47870 [Aulosira laxa NIES-50]
MPKAKPPEPQKNGALSLSDLSGDVSKAIVFGDSHFGLESAVWDNAQRIADMLPVDIKVFGDLTEEDVASAVEKAKGAEFQAKNWTEYSTAISRYLKALYKVREKQAEVSENVAEARVQQAELEKSLGTSLANLESKFRQIVGGSRSAIASVQDDLEISLGRIASQYSEGKAKKQEKLNTETTKKEPTPYEEQTASLVDRFRQLREARYEGASVGITQRIKKAE